MIDYKLSNLYNTQQGSYTRGITFKSKWHSMKWINGKAYRHRVETFIFSNDFKEIFAVVRDDNTYRIPGGHLQKKVSLMQQAVNECWEEAHIEVTNMRYVGSYLEDYNKFTLRTGPIEANGQFVEMFIGVVKAYHNKIVFRHDFDEEMYTKGKFHPVDEILPIMKESHKQIINLLVK